MDRLRRIFLTGLLVLTPLAISIWVLASLAVFLDNILGGVFRHFLHGYYVFGFGVISLLFIILLVGYLADNFLGRRLVLWLHHTLERVPIFNKLYSVVRGISDSVLGEGQKKLFQGAAMVPFPGNGIKTIGFLTATPKIAGKDKVGVFVPTPPNIANGFYLIYDRKDVEILDMPLDEALKLVISIGMFARKEPPQEGNEENNG